MNSKEIKKHIVNEISLMPDYHIEIFNEDEYSMMISVSNWTRLNKKKLDNGEYLRAFIYNPKCKSELDIIVTVHSDDERIFDVQYTFKNYSSNDYQIF